MSFSMLRKKKKPAERRGKQLVCLFLDFSSAFDRVTKEALIARLAKGSGSMGEARREEFMTLVRWVDDFLSARRVRARYEGALSEWEKIKVGVPQGTILGPACWKIFLSALQERLDGLGIDNLAFADDLALLWECDVSAADLDQNAQDMQRAVAMVEKWSDENNMQLVSDKTKMQVFGGVAEWGAEGEVPADTPVIRVGGKRVARVKAFKYLGVCGSTSSYISRNKPKK